MLASQIPTKFQIPFGNAAAIGTIRPVPVADQTATSPGAASLTTGFPPATGQPLASGGIPPAMQDFNGLFNQITAWNRWQNAGGTVQFDQTFCTAIGGYPQGAVLASTTPGSVWLNLVDNNTTNPDSGSSSNWAGILTTTSSGAKNLAGRLLGPPLVITASGNYTPSAGMVYVYVEGVGGGGGGGGTANPGANAVSLGAPGTAATYAQGMFTLAQVQAALVSGSIPVTIGAAGQGGVNGTGTNGGTTIFGTLMSIPGGIAGGPLNAQTAPTVNATGTTSPSATGAFFSRGGSAPVPSIALSSSTGYGAAGGDSMFGAGGYTKSANNTGANASGYGAGGAGTMTTAGNGSTGGNGSPGLLKVWEFGIVMS